MTLGISPSTQKLIKGVNILFYKLQAVVYKSKPAFNKIYIYNTFIVCY